MGFPLSSVLANLFVESFEHSVLGRAPPPPPKPVYFTRYVDDTVLIWPHWREKLLEFFFFPWTSASLWRWKTRANCLSLICLRSKRKMVWYYYYFVTPIISKNALFLIVGIGHVNQFCPYTLRRDGSEIGRPNSNHPTAAKRSRIGNLCT